MDKDIFDKFLRRITLRQVQVMVALQQHNSMTKAAESLGMTVGNVSLVSKRFENNLGIRMFEGDKNRKVLLDEANQIIDCLKPLAAEIEVLRDSFDQFPHGLSENVPRGEK